jgi:hypothetical protein
MSGVEATNGSSLLWQFQERRDAAESVFNFSIGDRACACTEIVGPLEPGSAIGKYVQEARQVDIACVQDMETFLLGLWMFGLAGIAAVAVRVLGESS